jgi:hypothetical protein
MTRDSDRWYAAMEHLKCAFKDESTVSNIGLANISFTTPEDDVNDSTEQLDSSTISTFHPNDVDVDTKKNTDDSQTTLGNSPKKIASKKITTDNITDQNGKASVVTEKDKGEATYQPTGQLINVDEDYSFRSYVPTTHDKYDPGYYDHSVCEDDMPGIIDVSSIQSENPGVFNISISQDEEMNMLLNRMDKDGNHLLMDDSLGDPDDDYTGSDHTGSTSDGGSILLNLWNEDYEGNPDPVTFKNLVEAEHLPKNLDPYIFNQIERAKIIQQLQELDDDVSSDGSCNFMCNQLFIPRHCQDGDSSECDSIVDTVINLDHSEKNHSDAESVESAEKSFQVSELNHKKPKQSMSQYVIPRDNQYRPGATPKELVLMLPKRKDSSCCSGDGMNEITNPHLPVQYCVGDDDDDDGYDGSSNDRSSKATYTEKEMEFTLQRYDSTPHRIAELVLKGKKSAAMDICEPLPELSSTIEEAPIIDLDRLTINRRRQTDDDDPIEEDRSVLSPEEIEVIRREKQEFVDAQIIYVKKRTALSQLMSILNNDRTCADTLPECIDDQPVITIGMKDLTANLTKDAFSGTDMPLIDNGPQDVIVNDNYDDEKEVEDEDDAAVFTDGFHIISSFSSESIVLNPKEESGLSQEGDAITNDQDEDNNPISNEESKINEEENKDTAIFKDRLHIISSTSTESASLNPVEEQLKSTNEEENNCEGKIINDVDLETITEGHDDVIFTDRLHIISSNSTVSAQLNPVDAQLRESQEENTCPNFQDSNIRQCSPKHSKLSTSEGLKSVQGDQCQEEKNYSHLSTPQGKEGATQETGNENPANDSPVKEISKNVRGLMEGRVLKTLGENIGNKEKLQEDKCIKAATCCSITSNSSGDSNVDELIDMIDVSIDSSKSDSVSDGEEVVIGVAVSGVHYTSPSSQFGTIIEPQHMEALRKLQTSFVSETDDKDVANTSRTSEQYAAMILDVTKCEDSVINTEPKANGELPVPEYEVTEDNNSKNESHPFFNVSSDNSASEREGPSFESIQQSPDVTEDVNESDDKASEVSLSYNKDISKETNDEDSDFYTEEQSSECKDSSMESSNTFNSQFEIREAETEIISNVNRGKCAPQINSCQSLEQESIGHEVTIKDVLGQLQMSMGKNSTDLAMRSSLAQQDDSVHKPSSSLLSAASERSRSGVKSFWS